MTSVNKAIVVPTPSMQINPRLEDERAAGLFRKKPVVISAVQFTKTMAEGHAPLPEGVVFTARSLAATGHFPEYANDGKYLTNYSTCHSHHIETLEGRMNVEIGDWVITGVKGERYPCKPDIFEQTYEPARAALNGADAGVSEGWQDIAGAPEGVLLVVGWLDPEDDEHPERHDFDYLEDGVWQKHSENVEHFQMCAPPGSLGPSEQAPYTHFMHIDPLPSAPTQGGSHGE